MLSIHYALVAVHSILQGFRYFGFGILPITELILR